MKVTELKTIVIKNVPPYIAGIAEAHYVTIAPHMYCGPIASATAVQIDTCSSNFLI